MSMLSTLHIDTHATLHMHTQLTGAGAGEVAAHIHSYYDARTPAGLGSTTKWLDVTRGNGIIDHPHSPNHPFIYLLNRLAALCAEHYSAQPIRETIDAAKAGTLADLCAKVPPPETLPSTSGPKIPLLNNHQAFIDVFEGALKEKTWPVLEKLADQVLDGEPTSSSMK